jgi:uroporphyrinogen-III synthase
MLEGKAIWLTRPAGQADNLTSILEEKKIKISSLPMLAIEPMAVDETIKATILDLDQFDLLFFISTNAASLGMTLIQDYWPQFPVQLSVYAAGPSTAAVLESFDVAAEYPTELLSSEALLALESLSEINNKKALIVRGVNGRELLAESLGSRGASVDYLEIYRRECPNYEQGALKQIYTSTSPDAVVVSSAQALTNFSALLHRDGLAPAAMTLYVSSSRLADIAAELGFKQTITMSGADDKAIIECIEEYL